MEDLENEIAENTSNVRHCNAAEDCYKIFKDFTIECVVPSNPVATMKGKGSYGRCKHQGCKRNNDNCYSGELCIRNRCVPVSEVKPVKVPNLQ